MTTSTPAVHGNVVVGVDSTSASAAAVRWAAAEAARRHVPMHAVEVVDDERRGGGRLEPDPSVAIELARRTVPARVVGWVFHEGIDVDIAVSVVTGDVAGRLAHEARDASLVVIGTPESAEHKTLPVELADQCLCPVAMVGEHGDASLVDRSIDSLSTEGASHHART
jgi:nucleotide-binding universal stress UspA family protein